MSKIKANHRINAKILSSVLKQIKKRPSIENIEVEEYRALLEKSASIFKPDKSVACEHVAIDSMSGAWLIPRDLTGQRIILYLHGGGFVAGSINSHRDLGARIARASNAKLLIINYRLAPEHKFPAGLNDALNAYKWLLNRNISSHNIIVAGDSAGGGLALSLLMLIKKQGLPMPGCAVFLSPWVDLECRGQSYLKKKEQDPMLTRDMLCFTIKLYTDRNQDISHPLISPINGDFNGLCPMLIQAGSCEILEDDARKIAIKAEQAGIEADLEIWDGMFHVFQYFSKYISTGREAIEKIGSFIRNKS